MRLAVFDTNVFISAGINGDGTPAALVTDWVLEGQVQLVTCPWIVEEYRDESDSPVPAQRLGLLDDRLAAWGVSCCGASGM